MTFIRLIGLASSLVLLLTFAARADDQYQLKTTDVPIPDGPNGAWVSSTIAISGAPSGAVVTRIDVYFKCIHTYSGDLIVDLNADAQGALGNRNLWNREGGAADNPTRTVNGVTTFNGLSVNRTWYLYARDMAASDTGYIDEWSIRVYYMVPPTISSVSPAQPVATGAQQLFTITGANFISTTTVDLEDTTTAEQFYNRTVTSRSGATEITIKPNFGTATTNHSWRVRVNNGSTPSAWFNFTVTVVPAPNSPAITSLSPERLDGLDGAQTLTLYGTNFATGCKVTLRNLTHGGAFTETPVSTTSTRVRVTRNFANRTATWTAMVVNPDQAESNEFRFYVDAEAEPPLPIGAPDLKPESVTVSPKSGVVGSSVTVSFIIRNVGVITSLPCVTNVRMNGSDSTVSTNDSPMFEFPTPAIAPGSSVNVNQLAQIPLGLASGTNYIWVMVDVDDTAGQGADDDSNDNRKTTFLVTAPPLPTGPSVPLSDGFDYPLKSKSGDFSITQELGDSDGWYDVRTINP